jgi:hypothetical protein
MKKIALALSLITIMSFANDYTMAPDGTYVEGNSYTMAPDGSFVGGNDYTMTPDGNYVGKK